MASPFTFFRKNQGVMLVVFTVLLMFVFTVGGIVMQMQGIAGRGANKDVVLTWKEGNVTTGEISSLRTTRRLLLQYSAALQEAAQKKDPDVNLSRAAMIPRDNSAGAVIQKMVLAQKARDMGMVVSDEAIDQYLANLTDRVLDENAIIGVRQRVLPKFSKESLYEAFRDELLAMNLLRMVAGDPSQIATGGVQVTTPVAAWQYYGKFNRRVTAEFVPFAVDDYVSKVTSEPTKAEIQDLYEEYKEYYPSPRSEDPGFKRPPHVKFGYVMVDFNKLVEEEKSKVTRQQMEEHYEQNRDKYRRPVIDDSVPSDDAVEDEEPVEEESTEPSDDAATTPDEEETSPPAPQSEESTPPASDGDEPAEPNSHTTEDNAATEGEGEGGTTTEPSDDDLELPGIEPLADDPTDTGEKVNEAPGDSSEPEEAGDVAPTDDGSSADGSTEEDADATDQATSEDEDTPETNDTSTEANEETLPSDDAAESTPDDNSAESPASETDAAEPEDDQEPEIEYKPLEEVEDEVRRAIALEPAQERLEAILKAAEARVEKYQGDLTEFKAYPDLTDDPGDLDAKKLAAELNAVGGETEMVSILDMMEDSDNELAQSYQTMFSRQTFQQRRIPFWQIGFQDDMNAYKPFRTQTSDEKNFLTWKIDSEEPVVPELSEIRDQVVAAWKRQKARELAKEAAEEFADKVGTKPLDKVAGAEQEVLKPQSFGYFTMISAILFQQRGSNLEYDVIEGIEDETTDAVKEAVISLPVGKVAVVPNQAKSVYYVAKVVSESIDPDKRREGFLQDIVDNPTDGGLPPAWQMMANAEHSQFFRQWYQQVEEELELEWVDNEFREQAFQGG